MLLKTFHHVCPNLVKLLSADRHMLVGRLHVTALVVVRPSKQHFEELGHSMMQLSNVTNVLEIENIDVIVTEDGLVEVCHNALDLLVASQSLIDSHQQFPH